MLTNWSLSGPDDNGHIWIQIGNEGHNLGPESETRAKMLADLRVMEIIQARLEAYRAKQARRDPTEGDCLNEWEKIEHTIEAFEWLIVEVERNLTIGERPTVHG